MQEEIAVCWLRRDLRLHDQAALSHALQSGYPVLCVFIFDDHILSRLEDKKDQRVIFIHRQLHTLNEKLIKLGSALVVRHGSPLEVWKKLTTDFPVRHVFAGHDYEPYAVERDVAVRNLLLTKNCSFTTCKDHVIFEKNEVAKENGEPYTVYTPFMKKWKTVQLTHPDSLKTFPTEKYFSNFKKIKAEKILSLEELGFQDADINFPSAVPDNSVIKQYASTRDFPAIEGTTRIGIHLRFGTVSVREFVRIALELSDAWVNELIWREFFIQVLWHFPHVAGHAFKKEYDRLKWNDDESGFDKWSNGQTGYPIVDAGMRELNETGFMHNRVRMLTACFLTKYLLIDWRWGEAYFAQKLLDYELASNNGNWQWSAGTGCDAAPYFRIFNMEAQTKKFDPDFTYIKKWVPENGLPSYPRPMMEYGFARSRCLAFFKNGLGR